MKLVAVVVALACACGSKSDKAAEGSGAAKTMEPAAEQSPHVPVLDNANALPPAPSEGVVVVVTAMGIVIDGKAIIAVHNGDVDPSEKEGGAFGMKMTRVARYADTLFTLETQKAAPPKPILLALDPTTPYRLVISTIYSLKPFRDYVLLARSHGQLVGAPLRLPETHATQIPERGSNTAEAPLGLAVAVTKDAITVWSISGLEGTISDPKAKLARQDFAGLTKALAEIAARRFAGKTRTAEDKQIILMCDGQVPAQDLLSLVAAVRAAPDGSELFPEVRLSSGFE